MKAKRIGRTTANDEGNRGIWILVGLAATIAVVGLVLAGTRTGSGKPARIVSKGISLVPTSRPTVQGEKTPSDPLSVLPDPLETAHLVPGRALYDAIRRVESGGDDFAVGDGGRSRGPYQCGRAAWADACEHGKLDWSYDVFVWRPWRCEYIMYLYWNRYGARTDEERARIWNGGPGGMQKSATLPYWNKVKAELARGIAK